MYIGKTPTVGNFQKCDAISVVNGQAAYTLQVGSANVSPESVNHMIVSLNGVIQVPTTAYTVAGAVLTFDSNLATGDVIDFVLLLGNVLDVGTPTDNTVATAKIQDDAVTLAKMAAGTDGNIISYDASGNPVAIATGTSGHFLKSQGAGAQPVFAEASGGKFASYAVIEDQKAQNTHGGAFTSGAWRTRDLNTEVVDVDGIVTVGSNQFTLAAGSYLIRWIANAKECDVHMSKLYDITGTADIEFGSSDRSDASDDTSSKSFGSTRVTPSGSNVYEIRHQCSSTRSTEGFGARCNFSVESYCLVEIYKES